MNNNQRLIIILLFFISVCIICFAVYLIIDTNDNPQPTQPTTIDPLISIANTSSAAQTQTAILLITIDSTPSISEFPTSFTQPTLAPTWTPAPTDTPFILTLVTIPASDQGDQGNQCSCTADTFNCGDALAETCFNYCNSQGYGDIHRLDQNNNGIACEDY